MVKLDRGSSARERFNFSKLAIAYPWLTLGFWIAVTVAGVLAFSSLKYALFPDITFPVVVVNASAPLPSAVETEQQLTNPLEQKLQVLSDQGLDEIRSTTYPGRSIISLAFDVGTDLEASSREVKAALDQLQLPTGANFEIAPINLNEAAVISYAIQSSSQNLSQLAEVADSKIVPAIANLPGVLKANLLGRPASVNAATPTSAAEAARSLGTLVRFDGEDALALEVVKRNDANTLEVVRDVEQTIERLRAGLPDVEITLAATQAEYIQEATQATIDALALAVLLAVLVIYPFLWNFRATLITALAIPTSLLGTFIVMAIFGFNLETITLLALALVIGIIVDDAIVDVENITRHLEKGETPRQAAILATQEIGLTVTAATFAIAAVFLPVALMGGVVGQFFKPFGVTVSAAVITSWLVSRTLAPLLAVYWLKARRPKHAGSDASADSSPQVEDGILSRLYRSLLRWSLGHRWLVLGLAVLSFAGGIALIPLIPKGFIPKLDRGEFNITYTSPLPSLPSNLAQQAAAAGLSQEQLAAQAQAGQDLSAIAPGNLPADLAGLTAPPINPLQESLQVAKELEAFVLKSPAVETVFTTVGSRQGQPNKGTLYVKLRSDRTVDTATLQDQFRQEIPKLPGVTTSIEDIQFVDTGGEKPLQIVLLGDDLETLDKTAQTIQSRIEKLPGFADVTATSLVGEQGNIIEIQHRSDRRAAYVSANLGQGLSLGDATERVVAEAEAVLPPGVEIDLGGDSARIGEVFGSFGTTLGLSVLCILAVLILLFQSWTDPLVIIFSLPLAIVGAMLALLVTQSDFGMISLIGVIFLMGLVNKNAILIVDYINQLRRSGWRRTEAIVEAGSVRLRPILMTTASTILGMLPIALGLGAGSELRAPMAIAIIGGLITSTLLSLIGVPVVYALLDSLRPRFKSVQSP